MIARNEWMVRDSLVGNDHFEIDINLALNERILAKEKFEKQGWKLDKYQQTDRMYLTENMFRTVNTLTVSTKKLFDTLPEAGFFTL